jgi:membrane protease YdiL (CAAX protease family)
MAKLEPALVFLILVLALSGLAEAVLLAAGGGNLALGAVAWSPALAALLALKITGRPLASLGSGWGGWRHHLIAVLLPFAYAAVGYGGAALFGLVRFASPEAAGAFVASTPLAGSLPAALLLTMTVGIAASALVSVGEEVGWRGLLAPRLTARFGFAPAVIVLGLVWGAWHLPMILWGGYDGGGARGPEIACFLVTTVTLSAPMAWLRLTSGSFLPCATLHGAHNLVLIGLFDRLTERGLSVVTMVGEFGVVSAAALAVVSLPFWIAGARAAGSAPSGSPRSATDGQDSSCRAATRPSRP